MILRMGASGSAVGLEDRLREGRSRGEHDTETGYGRLQKLTVLRAVDA